MSSLALTFWQAFVQKFTHILSPAISSVTSSYKNENIIDFLIKLILFSNEMSDLEILIRNVQLLLSYKRSDDSTTDHSFY